MFDDLRVSDQFFDTLRYEVLLLLNLRIICDFTFDHNARLKIVILPQLVDLMYL